MSHRAGCNNRNTTLPQLCNAYRDVKFITNIFYSKQLLWEDTAIAQYRHTIGKEWFIIDKKSIQYRASPTVKCKIIFYMDVKG